MQLESWEEQWKDLSLLQQVILLNEITQAWKELFVYLFDRVCTENIYLQGDFFMNKTNNKVS